MINSVYIIFLRNRVIAIILNILVPEKKELIPDNIPTFEFVPSEVIAFELIVFVISISSTIAGDVGVSVAIFIEFIYKWVQYIDIIYWV